MYYLGGIADEVNEEILQDNFIKFGDITNISLPIDYSTRIFTLNII